MSKVNQKEAVFAAVTNVLSQAGHNMTENEDVAPLMEGKELRAQVSQILLEGFTTGTIELKEGYDTAKLKMYTSSVLSNWLRKDTRLNGGVKYVAKNPGSRAGAGDEQLKAIRLVKSTISVDDPRYADVVAAEATRMSELQAAKVKPVEINLSALPTALATLFSK